MTGTLEQVIALAAYGNDFLKNGTDQTAFDTHLMFQYCNTVDFRELNLQHDESKPEDTIVAEKPSDWFKYLKNDGCKYLRLYFQGSADQSMAADHKLAGMVGGGGTWAIEAVYINYSNFWVSRWEVNNQNTKDNKVWTVNYGRTLEHQRTADEQIDIENVKTILGEVLTEIAEFAYDQNLENWGETFERANNVLNDLAPEQQYYDQTLIPVQNYSLAARQILFAAGSAWVFGGMGSWNDQGFATQEANETYDTLSADLYNMIGEAVIAAVNSY